MLRLKIHFWNKKYRQRDSALEQKLERIDWIMSSSNMPQDELLFQDLKRFFSTVNTHLSAFCLLRQPLVTFNVMMFGILKTSIFKIICDGSNHNDETNLVWSTWEWRGNGDSNLGWVPEGPGRDTLNYFLIGLGGAELTKT